MRLPLTVAVKSFLGLYVITPFERKLIDSLAQKLGAEERYILERQLSTFTTVRRLIRHLDVPDAHGYTNFYTLRFGKDVSAERQTARFPSTEPEAMVADARVVFDSGEIDIQFWLVRGVLFRIEYRSPQKIYYPPNDNYRIEDLRILLPDKSPPTPVSIA